MLLLGACDSQLPPGDAGDRFRLVLPGRILRTGRLPIWVTALNSTGKTDPGFSGAVNLELTPAGSGPGVETVSLKRGSGAALVPVDANGAVELSMEGTSRTVSAAVEAVTLVPGGTLPPGDHRWENGDYVVEADLTIPGEGNLTVSPGCIIYLEPGVNIIVEGGLFLEGAGAEPVVLAPLDPLLPWGGVEVTEGVLTADWTIFQGGGGDPSREFGHSHSQPVVMFRRAAGGFSHCLFLDNPGKALGAWESTLDFTAGLITRCDTGGEFQFSLVRIQSSHILDIPSDDHVFVDDDNDGFYFNGLPDWTQDTSRVENCCFVTGKDDALDHNGARLLVQNCWIEDFIHEGVAASNRNVAVVRNCLFRNCDQGVEAGYGEPLLVVEHCVLLENGTGIRFGDSYDWGCSGRIEAVNCVLYGNDDNIRNFDLQTQGAVPGVLNIAYSLTNDPDYDGNPGCLAGEPLFDGNYLLTPGSPGWNAGNDGNSMGLLVPLQP